MNPIKNPAVRKVFKALGGDARLVGGCVRDYLTGVPCKDFDMATPLLPEQVMARLTRAGIKVVPTGLKHGTVTAVAGRQAVEITTLRTDVKTDGRHAQVRFTNQYEMDARRRDFTMNALYMGARGEVYDFVGGLEDLKARRVRFIGDARARIREDYLRILRYFRFWSKADRHAADAGILRACKELKDGLACVSDERKTDEFLKILMTPRAVEALKYMRRAGVLGLILPKTSIAGLEKILKAYPKAGAMERLSALVGRETGVLRLSNVQKKELADLSKKVRIGTLVEDKLYFSTVTPNVFRFQVYKALAVGKITKKTAVVRIKMRQPKFPVTGKDLVRAGFRPGPGIGALMDKARQIWADAGFPTKKVLVIERLLAYNKSKEKGDKP